MKITFFLYFSLAHFIGKPTQSLEKLLEFSRLTHSPLVYQTVDLNELIHKLLRELEPAIGERQASISLDTLPVVDADPSQIRQVFFHLMENSLKFIKPAQNPQIRIYSESTCGEEKQAQKLSDQTEYISIRIQDNGIGFDNSYASYIFEPFRRLHEREQYPGSGMGLAICQKIAENHQGAVHASGVDGHGSVFSLVIPRFTNP